MLEIDFLFRINFNLVVETKLYNTYNRRLMHDFQLQEVKDGGGGNCENGSKTGSSRNDQIKQDEAGPMLHNVRHSTTPVECKEMDTAIMPQVARKQTRRDEADPTRGANDFALITGPASPQAGYYLRQDWV